jgi:hypothetical protein
MSYSPPITAFLGRPQHHLPAGVRNNRQNYDFITRRLLAGECYESLTLQSLPRRRAAAKTRVVKTTRLTMDERPATVVARCDEGPDRAAVQRLETFFLARRAAVRAEKLSDSA